MHVPWIFVIAGARAPVAELASLDVHANEPYAARGTHSERSNLQDTFETDNARREFLLKEPPGLSQTIPKPQHAEVPWHSEDTEPASSRAPEPQSGTTQEPALEGSPAPWHSAAAELASPRGPHLRSGVNGESFLEKPRFDPAAPPLPPDPAPDPTGRTRPELRGVIDLRNSSVYAAAKPRVEERILLLTRDLFVEAPLLFIVPGIAIVSIIAVLALLLRYAKSGLGAVNHWSGQLTRRTDWSQLKDGAFVKVCGTTAAPDRHFCSPLGGRPCAAYRISVAYDDGDSWVPLITREDRTGFHILDDAGRALLVAENDFHMYDVASEEWSFPAGAAPPRFLDLCAPAPAAGLRFREEVVAVGAKVSCVGAVSRLALESTLDSAGALRPAYAVLMFRDDRIPWAKMTDLAQGDWKQLAARVLVSADR